MLDCLCIMLLSSAQKSKTLCSKLCPLLLQLCHRLYKHLLVLMHSYISSRILCIIIGYATVLLINLRIMFRLSSQPTLCLLFYQVSKISMCITKIIVYKSMVINMLINQMIMIIFLWRCIYYAYTTKSFWSC